MSLNCFGFKLVAPMSMFQILLYFSDFEKKIKNRTLIDLTSIVGIIWLCLWCPSIVVWFFHILIGQSAAAWPIKMSRGHATEPEQEDPNFSRNIQMVLSYRNISIQTLGSIWIDFAISAATVWHIQKSMVKCAWLKQRQRLAKLT